jgi:hypothetical protein
MLSPRSRFEFACRTAAFAALGWLLGVSLLPAVTHGVERATAANLSTQLPQWTKLPASVALHADLATAPNGPSVDWLAALRRSGHAVSWSGSPPAVVLTAEALTDPNGGARIEVAAARGTAVLLRDRGGLIDSLRVNGVGVSATAPLVIGDIDAIAGNQRIGISAPDTAHVRAVVVIGDAGWEGKFIVSALEERGWPVIARFSVAPNVDVTDGATIALDTSRVAAVIAVDSSIQFYGASLDRYVRSGGGLILAGEASKAPSVASLAPGLLGARVRPAVEPTDTISLGSTGFYPVSLTRGDAVVLDRRPAGIAIAARRVGAGRVLQMGFDDSWRWRMAGGPGSERAHREWWSRVVSSVAYVSPEQANTSLGESAPLARLVDALGPSLQIPEGTTRGALIDSRIIVAFMMLCLLAEWTSRRMRGFK